MSELEQLKKRERELANELSQVRASIRELESYLLDTHEKVIHRRVVDGETYSEIARDIGWKRDRVREAYRRVYFENLRKQTSAPNDLWNLAVDRRIRYALKKSGFETIDDIIDRQHEIPTARGIGDLALSKIKEALPRITAF